MLTYTFPVFFFFNLPGTELRDRMVNEFLHVSKVFIVLIISILFKLQAGNLPRIKHAGI